MASWIMVSSRWVVGLSTGMRAFSASSTMMKATAANARLACSARCCDCRYSAIVGNRVLPEISDEVNTTISSAGSARKPTIMSRRAPMLPKAVPMSMPARAVNTRASANSPTSAMTSAACANGRSVESEGMMAAATTMMPISRYGTTRNSAVASCASTASLRSSLAMRA